MTANLTSAEKRALRLAYENSLSMPILDNVSASTWRSRPNTLDNLTSKGLLIRSPYRGLTYFLTDAAVALGKRLHEGALPSQNGTDK